MSVDFFELEKSFGLGFPWHENLLKEACGSFNVLTVVLNVTNLGLVDCEEHIGPVVHLSDYSLALL